MALRNPHILIIIGVILVIAAFALDASFIFPRELWLALGLISLCTGIFLILKQKFIAVTTPASPLKDLEEIRRTGNHIRISLDNFIVKHRSFQQDIVEEPLPSQAANTDALFYLESSAHGSEIKQTYIVVEEVFNDIPYKYVSHPTQLDPVSVKLRIEEKGGDLYIDKSNPTVYFFQLPF